MSYGGRAVFVDERTGVKPFQREQGVDIVRHTVCDGMRQTPAHPGVALNWPVPQPQLRLDLLSPVPTIERRRA